MTDDRDRPRINLGYPLSRLAKALSGAGERAAIRVQRWRQVVSGLLAGSLRVGSRTPVADTPAWLTLEVLHGGFATGNLAAGGPLLPSEVAKLRSVPHVANLSDRAVLNLHFLGDAGRGELAAMLASGCFRVHVPEEAALLVTTWLLAHGETSRAERLVENIRPFFDRLRFYPVPHSTRLRSGTGVHVQTAGEAVASLRTKRPQRSVERMNEALAIWTPLHDRVIALFLETVEGETPALRTSSGEPVRSSNGQPVVDGGWPCRRYGKGWTARAREVLADYRTARTRHQLCGKPEDPKENFARLRGLLAKCADDPDALNGREVGTIRKILASHVTRHGAPGSSRRQATRAAQARDAAKPLHYLVASTVAQRLEKLPSDEGVSDLQQILGPLSAQEAKDLGGAGEPLPKAVVVKAMRCLEAPLASLVEQGLVPSSEGMARLVPPLTARVRAAAIEDAELRSIYEAVYVAFRRRRSLLLLDLESQTRLGELPWISAVEPWAGSAAMSRDANRTALVQTAILAIEAFPHTIIPNKLVKELRVLATGAGFRAPLVDELAADIFMGSFSENFLRAAQLAARLLKGTLYERYYGLPYDRVVRLEDVERARFGTPTSPGFGALCEHLATARDRSAGSVARNGTVIEQAQILTTHNLAALFDACGLTRSMQPRLPDLARQCFRWICRRQQATIKDWRAQLQMTKNTAYAWRQMVFFLSLISASELGAFLEWSAEHFGRQRREFRQRFEPVMAGLSAVVAGEEFGADGRHLATGGRRFLGWSVGRHWLLPSTDGDPRESVS